MTLLFSVLRDSDVPGTHLCHQTIQEVIPEVGSWMQSWGKCHRCVIPSGTFMLLQAHRQNCDSQHPKLWFTATDGGQVLNLAYQ